MRMTWVNHASFLLDSGDVRLICDPWIDGRVFNDGWHLLSPTVMQYEDFASVTHIWFSHEHPDHFFPPNLKRIPEEVRKRITVLFHETQDKRVLNVCRSMGFLTEELPEGRRTLIADGFEVLNGRNELIDSWLAVFAEGKTILNLNDCLFPSKNSLLELVGTTGKVDLLLSQFSYANWVGNPDDRQSHEAHAVRKREEMSAQIQEVRPHQFIPFASFVYFCHEENFFMNDSANKIGDIYRFVTDELGQEALVLYPGDRWEVGSPHDSQEAIEKYERDFQVAVVAAPTKSTSVSMQELQRAMAQLVQRCESANSSFVLKAMPCSVVFLKDLGDETEISFRHGIRRVETGQPDLILSSDSLMYCIKTDWGGETLKINGRFEVPAGGNPQRFFRLFRVPQYNSYGSSVDLRFLASRFVDAMRRAAN